MSSLICQRFQGFFVTISDIVITYVSHSVTSLLQILSPKNKITSCFIYLYVQDLAVALLEQLHSDTDFEFFRLYNMKYSLYHSANFLSPSRIPIFGVNP